MRKVRNHKYIKSRLKSVDLVKGETIEMKIQRIMENKEPIKDGAPLIYTDRKEGVVAAYNIRTDRWEVAAEAMDVVNKSKMAKGEEKPKMEVNKDDDQKDSGAESIQATGSDNES